MSTAAVALRATEDRNMRGMTCGGGHRAAVALRGDRGSQHQDRAAALSVCRQRSPFGATDGSQPRSAHPRRARRARSGRPSGRPRIAPSRGVVVSITAGGLGSAPCGAAAGAGGSELPTSTRHTIAPTPSSTARLCPPTRDRHRWYPLMAEPKPPRDTKGAGQGPPAAWLPGGSKSPEAPPHSAPSVHQAQVRAVRVASRTWSRPGGLRARTAA